MPQAKNYSATLHFHVGFNLRRFGVGVEVALNDYQDRSVEFKLGPLYLLIELG